MLRTQQYEAPPGAAAVFTPALVPLPDAEGEALTLLAVAYRDHSAAVYGLAARMCGPQFAADVTQAVFVHLGTYPEALDRTCRSMRAYLLTLTRDRALAIVPSGRGPDSPAGATRVRQDLSADKPGADRLTEALACLHPQERAAIETTVYGQCTYRDTAAVLGRSEDSVRSSLGSGMRRLRRALAQRPG